MKELTPSEIIARLGGQKAVCEMTGRSQPTISGWANGRIPDAWLRYLQATRPEVFTAQKRRKAS